jgi:3-hydroxyisobutyrate dehydrogenase-like beta-hydroxyacid dehydrogenase
VIEVLQASTGTSDAATRTFPRHILPDKDMGIAIKRVHKDLKTYLRFAEEMEIPTFVSNAVFQIWNLHMLEGRGEKDGIHFVELYEKWGGSKIRGITRK